VRPIGSIVAFALLLALAAASPAGAAEERDYLALEARVTDTQGVETTVREFTFWTGPNVLSARLGEADMEIPFRLLRSIEFGEYAPERGTYPCRVVARTGKAFDVLVERIDAQRYLGGTTDVGRYKIRLAQIRRIDFAGLSRAESPE
jgi:hypothetical protein